MSEPRSFNIYKNVVAPIIAILDHLEANIKISYTGVETIESNNCKEILEDKGDAISTLVTMQKKFTFIQSWAKEITDKIAI